MADTAEHRQSPKRTRLGLKSILLLTVVVVAGVVLFATFTPVDRLDPDTAVAWRADFQQAIDEADAARKPVLMHFSSAYCGPCQQMKQWVYPRRQLAELIAQEYVPLQVDLTNPTREAMTAANALSIQYLPTIMVFDPDGREMARHEGAMTARELTMMLESSLAALAARPTTEGPTASLDEGTQP